MHYIEPENLKALYYDKSIDEYTAVLNSSEGSMEAGELDCLGFNSNPTHCAYGVSMFGVCREGARLGKKINFCDLAEYLQDHVTKRLAKS